MHNLIKYGMPPEEAAHEAVVWRIRDGLRTIKVSDEHTSLPGGFIPLSVTAIKTNMPEMAA
jgi:hypothetical protein